MNVCIRCRPAYYDNYIWPSPGPLLGRFVDDAPEVGCQRTITCRLAPFRGLHMGFQSHPALSILLLLHTFTSHNRSWILSKYSCSLRSHLKTYRKAAEKASYSPGQVRLLSSSSPSLPLPPSTHSHHKHGVLHCYRRPPSLWHDRL